MATKECETNSKPVCLICEAENAPEAIICAYCCAPMALVDRNRERESKSHIISVVGDSNVGKTIYLGVLLDMLSQRAGDFEAVPQGAYSIDLQQNVVSHLAHRMFPPKTPMEANQWYWAHYQVRRRASRNQMVDLVMPDMAGESLAAEVATPMTYKVIHGLLKKSGGLLLLVDAALAANGATQPDFFALKVLSYIDSMHRSRRGRKVKTPIAILLCKSDHCPECFDDPRAFMSANLQRTWNLCDTRFETVDFFATSVVGSLAYATAEGQEHVTPIPLHTALRGILEPFEWVLDKA